VRSTETWTPCCIGTAPLLDPEKGCGICGDSGFMEGAKAMLNSIVCHIEFRGKGRTSRRKFLIDIWSLECGFGNHVQPDEH